MGLAVLGLLSGVAGDRPLVCVIDDQQWLDQASAQALGFVARRSVPTRLGWCSRPASRAGSWPGCPNWKSGAWRMSTARALLDLAIAGPLDARVRDLIIAEAQGNPLALLELPRGLGPGSWLAGSGCPASRR